MAVALLGLGCTVYNVEYVHCTRASLSSRALSEGSRPLRHERHRRPARCFDRAPRRESGGNVNFWIGLGNSTGNFGLGTNGERGSRIDGAARRPLRLT
eukprot:scaffold18698_cov31-Tisochrysis_lutea.AAC.1